MIRCFQLIMSVMLLAGFAVSAPAQVTFKLEFPDGRKSTVETQIKTSQTITIAGQEIVADSSQSHTVLATNGQRAADGSLTVDHRVEAFKAVVKVADTELEFDSANPDADPPGTLLDIFKATAKSTWQSVMNQDNRVVAVKGRDAAFADLPQTTRDAMKPQLDPEYLRSLANDELTRLPSEPVSPGDSWVRANTIRLDSGQRFTFTNRYTYEGYVRQNDKKLERIASKVTDVKYFVEGDAPLKVLESDLNVVASDGMILFDPAIGQIVSQHSKLQIKGSLNLEVMDQEFPGELDMTVENSVILKEIPAEAAPSSRTEVYLTEPLIGEIRINAFTFAPRGWAFCDGQLLAIKDNEALFSLLGTTYGGDGRTTFALPDLRGRTAIHAGATPGFASIEQGQKLEGEKVAATDTAQGSATRPYLGVNYVIALYGTYPSRSDGSGNDSSDRIVGDVSMFAGTFAPAGWAFCDGQQLPIPANKSLFAAIGRTYGGDDAGFSLPDLRATTPVHAGHGPGLDNVTLGERGGGKKVAPAQGGRKSVTSRSYQGIRYIIAVRGIAPEPSVQVTGFVGEICIVARESGPRGWTACDGQLLPVSDHTALFSLLGTTYGGDGRTTFALPDLRGRTPVHTGNKSEITDVKPGGKGGGTSIAAATDPEKAVSTQPYLGLRYSIAMSGIYPSRN